jgi:glycosyltransferase involved in cell wall biosynthesis
MNYHANIDGAVHFARDIWPSIRALNPHLTLTLVGADPAPAVQALATQPGIAVTGTVPEILPYYRDALAAVVPLRTGSGTRLKILEAMAAGVPVISTRIGAEGLDATPDTNILIAQFQDDWLRHLRQLSSAEAWQSLADAGLHLPRSRYDWTALGERMASVYRSWLM